MTPDRRLLTLLVCAALAAEPAPPDVAAKLSEYAEARAKVSKFSGALLVAREGKPLLRYASGMANYELDVANTPATKFRIGSVTKQFTAAAVLILEERGKLKVHRLVIGTDSGHVVNPDQVDAQVVGSVAYGLSATMFEEMTMKNGAMVEQNLDTYEILRMADFPKVEVVTVPSGGFWGGVGEPTIMVAGPAVLNAIFAATGKPVRSLPLKNVKLRA